MYTLLMLLMSKSNDKQYRLIRIDQRNYEILNSLGKTNDTFNTVLTKIFEQNALLGVVTSENEA